MIRCSESMLAGNWLTSAEVLPAIRRLAAAGWTRVNVEVADGADTWPETPQSGPTPFVSTERQHVLELNLGMSAGPRASPAKDHGTSDELENHWMDSFLAQFFASL